jgi:CheY-like chemotaxis protein
MTNLERIKILVVDDTINNQLLISKILQRNGADVELARNGAEAFQMAISETKFDVIIMDLQMPVMDGYEATRSLRRAGFAGPIIACSAHALEYHRMETRSAGCDGHLPKPIDAKTLVSSIQSALQSRAG